MKLYDDDYVTWTRQQAALLRTMPATSGLDIGHLVDEIEGLGRSAITDLSTAIRNVLAGLIRRSIDPTSTNIEDIYSAQSDAIICSDAGVWRHVDLDKIWRLARRAMDVDLSERCPLSIEQLVAEDFEIQKAIAALRL